MPKAKSFLSNLIKPFKSTNKDKEKEEDLKKLAAEEHKLFSFESLVHATKSFHNNNKLGEGGFGPVYKGKLEDGREVAVKKLSQSSRQGKREFVNEAQLLARVQHRNVVNLLGYCANGVEKLLVYEYLPHQSLDKLLFHTNNRNELDWKKRYDVIVGVARGLLYLHEDSHICIIHRDIKASNILLDDKWAPKIADFGMARLFPEDQTHVNTRVAGTDGYMAPEYVMYGQLSVKADVFSFGVLVLEIISGQKNSSFKLDTAPNGLLEWVWKLYKKGTSLEILDASMVSGATSEEVAMCIKIGLLCTQADPKLRPNMRRVVVMLSKKAAIAEEPTRPGYPGCRYRRACRPAGSSSIASESSLTSHISSSTTRSSGESSHTCGATTSKSSTNASTSTLPTPKSRSSGESSHTYGATTSKGSTNASTSTLPTPKSRGKLHIQG